VVREVRRRILIIRQRHSVLDVVRWADAGPEIRGACVIE
jgi:hypothetical protein